MKSKKWTPNRNPPSSRLIVDEYDLIQKQTKQQHAICQFCQQHIPQRLIVSHKNVCIMAENNEYYAGSKVESEQAEDRDFKQENNRKKIGSKLKKKLRRTSSNASVHKSTHPKKPQPAEFCNNPSLFSQKSNRKSNKKQNHSSTYQKCNSVRKLSTKYEKKPILTNQSSKGSEHDKLKKKPKPTKESYYDENFKKGLSKKGKKIEKRELPSKMEVREKKYEKQREMKREKQRERQQEKKRRERERQREIERERERQRQRRRQEERRNQQTERRGHNSGYRRRNNRNQQSQNRRPRNVRRQEFIDEESFEEEFSNYPHQTFNFITQTMNEQFQMMRQQFQNMSQFFNNFQGFQTNNGFVFYHSNVSDSSEDGMYYEEEEQEQEEEQGLAEEEIEIIPKFRYKKRNGVDEQCTVCLNTLKGNEMVRSLPCQHVFHCDCIDEWLLRKAACPVCRENIRNLLV